MADDGADVEGGLFPITEHDLFTVASSIRAELRRNTDGRPEGLTAALKAIERLPIPTDDQIEISVSDRYGKGAGRAPGNYDWATLEITDYSMAFSTGQHFYGADEGGDSETSTIFACNIDGFTQGRLADWLGHFDRLAEYGLHASSEEMPDPDVDDEGDLVVEPPTQSSGLIKDAVVFNSELMALGLELTADYIQRGQQSFKEVACALAADLDVTMKHLERAGVRGWYEGARAMLEDNGADVSRMDTLEDARERLEVMVTVEGWVVTKLGTVPDER